METTLGEATKVLDNIMANYSQWHSERSSTSKKVHAIEETNVLSGKMDELMKLFCIKSAPIDPNDMPFATLIENNNEPMDVNFFGRNNFGNSAYRGNFNPRPFHSNSSIIMEIPTTILMEILIIYPLILNPILNNLLLHKRISML